VGELIEITERQALVRFKPEVLQRALDVLNGTDSEVAPRFLSLTTSAGTRTTSWPTWHEFLAEFSKTDVNYAYAVVERPHGTRMTLVMRGEGRLLNTLVKVRAQDREFAEQVLAVFVSAVEDSRVTEEDGPTIFIGHGPTSGWQDLKDQLQGQHGYQVDAFETGARAGHTIRDILASMTKSSSFALLVLTAEDQRSGRPDHVRQNVIHDAGLFQGALGFDRAIILLENGAEEFSNLAGIRQLHFDAGQISEVLGDVLARLHREFGPPPVSATPRGVGRTP
jgi:hypothetical protein